MRDLNSIFYKKSIRIQIRRINHDGSISNLGYLLFFKTGNWCRMNIFICGKKCDCDVDGPGVLLLSDTPYEVGDTEENREKYKDLINGGSVSCSECGESAASKALWELP